MEHITRISLYLNPVSNCELSQAQVNSFGPMLQSVLMENVREPYVDKLHLPFLILLVNTVLLITMAVSFGRLML